MNGPDLIYKIYFYSHLVFSLLVFTSNLDLIKFFNHLRFIEPIKLNIKVRYIFLKNLDCPRNIALIGVNVFDAFLSQSSLFKFIEESTFQNYYSVRDSITE